MSSAASPFTARRAMLLVVLMVLMGQAGYFQSGYWMNGEDSTPVEPLAATTDGPTSGREAVASHMGTGCNLS